MMGSLVKWGWKEGKRWAMRLVWKALKEAWREG